MAVLVKHESDVVPGSDERPIATGGLSENKYPEGARMHNMKSGLGTSPK